MQFGGLNTKAHELRVPLWFDAEGTPLDTPLALADLGPGYKIIYNF